MDSKTVLQSNYLDLIFYGRNKAYGSYQLRTTYPQRMRKAGMYIFLLTALLATYMVWANRAKPAPVMPLEKTIPVVNIINPELDIPDDPVEPPEMMKKIEMKTELFIPPDIVDDHQVKPEEELATQEELKNAVAGSLKISEGEIGNESIVIPEGEPGGNDLVEKKKPASAKIPTWVEQMPEFPGGEEKLREYLGAHLQYPSKAMDAGQQGNVNVKFVVNEDGSVSSVTALRGFGYGSEDEAVKVVSGMPKWKPGRTNGKPVKVWFHLPIIFRLN